MKKTILALGIVLSLASCSKSGEVKDALHSLNLEMSGQNYYLGDKINLPESITSNAQSISYSDGEGHFEGQNFDPKFFSMGENTVSITVKLKNGDELHEDLNVVLYAKNEEKKISFDVVAQYPHQSTDFCQGFEYLNNSVYEGTGQEGESKIQKYSLGQTPSQMSKNTPDIFGEGITLLNNKIYQLTWKNGKMLEYDMGLKPIKEHPYPATLREGWGLTNNGKELMVSDGSSQIYFINPNKTNQIARKIGVAGHNEIFNQLNELEFHNGFIYANVWHKNFILKIDAQTGAVVAKIDLENLAKENMTDSENVLNGIAFKGENMLVTGKNWSKIYEIKLK